MEIPQHPDLSLSFAVALKIPADSNRSDSQEWLLLPLCLFGVVNPKTRCKKPLLGLKVPPMVTHLRGSALATLPSSSVTRSLHPCPIPMTKDEPHIEGSLSESIFLLNGAGSHGSLQMGDCPTVLWQDPCLLWKVPSWIRMLCPHWVYNYSSPLPHWTFKDSNKVLPNISVMQLIFFNRRKSKYIFYSRVIRALFWG